MLYIPAEKSPDCASKFVYKSKDGKTEQTFDTLDWLARTVVHILNKYEQLTRYLGAYSNKSRGMRKKAGTDGVVLSIAPGELTSKQFRRRWARLIQKIYEVDPLCCPNCSHQMRVISIGSESLPIRKKFETRDRRRTAARNRPFPMFTGEKPGVVSLTKSEFLS